MHSPPRRQERWLVTGGVGFIGYHVSRALLDDGADVTIVDDFSDAPYPTACKERNARDLAAAHPRVAIVRGSVTDGAMLAPLVREADVILHLAGLAGVRPSFAEPARYAHVNVTGTARVLELARAAGTRRVLFASSSSVYGNATPLPAQEDAAAVAPESPYAASKRAGELIATALFGTQADVAVTALRPFTVYGPRQRPEMAITLFARAMLAGRPVTVFGDASVRRDFTHVDDITRGMLAAAERTTGGFRVYNLGSGRPVTILELVAALGATLGVSPIIERAPLPRGDVDATFADISRAAHELHWSPQVDLASGLRTVFDWVRHNPA